LWWEMIRKRGGGTGATGKKCKRRHSEEDSGLRLGGYWASKKKGRDKGGGKCRGPAGG